MTSLIKHAGSIALTTLVGMAAAPVIVGAVAGLIPSVALSALSIGLLAAEKKGRMNPGMTRILVPIATLLTIATATALFYLFSVPLVAIILIGISLAVIGYILTPKVGYYLVDKPDNSEIDALLKPYNVQLDRLGYNPTSQDPDIVSRQTKHDYLFSLLMRAKEELERLKQEGKELLLSEDFKAQFNKAMEEPSYV